MKRDVANVAASVRQRLLNESKRRRVSFDYVASLYARERFLTRLAASPHRNRLILKGATVLSLWLDVHRTTRDLDFLGHGTFTEEEAIAMIREIVEVNIRDDGLRFDPGTVTAEPIRELDEYRGIRLHLDATLDSARIRLQVDVGLGDVVTPAATTQMLPAILEDFPGPRIKVYPPETIVAEKLQALVKLGIANSRMKDFFDLYVLARNRDFDEALLSEAVRRTFARRRTAVPEDAYALSRDFYADEQKRTQWFAFLRKSGVEIAEDFGEVGELLHAFLAPVLKGVRSGKPSGRRWHRDRWRAVR